MCPQSATDITKAYDETKLHLTATIFIIGMTFGASFSNEKLPLHWWETALWKRLARGTVAVAVYALILFIFCNNFFFRLARQPKNLNSTNTMERL